MKSLILMTALLAQALQFPGPGIGAFSFSGFSFRRSVTIDHTQVPNTDQSNFTVVVRGTLTYLKTVANGGNVQSSSGFDIIFTSDSGCSTKLSWEQEFWSGSSGDVVYWVKLSSVSHTVDTVFYICYGNSSTASFQGGAAGSAWSAFGGVYHLPDGTTLSANDSSGNGNNASSFTATVTTGQLDGGASFDGSTKSVTMPDVLDMGTNDATITAWVNTNVVAVTNQNIVAKRDSSVGTNSGYQIFQNTGSQTLSFAFGDGSASRIRVDSTAPVINDSTWHQVGVVFTRASNGVLYVDGSAATNGSGAISAQNGNQNNAVNLFIGREGTSGWYTGTIDEVHISLSARSADWIKTEYNNQKPSSTFLTISAPF